MDHLSSSSSKKLMERFIAQAASFDEDEAEAIYSPDCRAWNNVTGQEVGHRELQKTREYELAHIPAGHWVFEDVRGQLTETGFMAEFVVTGKLDSGADVRIPVCTICTVENERIVRLTEYMDSEDAAAVSAVLAPHFQNA